MAAPGDVQGVVFEHGSITVGLTAVVAQAQDLRLREWTGYNAGPGKVYPGTSSVSSGNTVSIAVGDTFVTECVGTLYLIADQAGTTVTFIRERIEV